jgi:hypothetical protein
VVLSSLLVILSVCLTQSLRAQYYADALGARTRVLPGPDGTWLVGTLERLGHDTLYIRQCAACPATPILRSNVQLFQVSEGSRRAGWPGGLLGGSLGALAGGFIGYQMGLKSEPACTFLCELDALDYAVPALLIGGAVGAVLGATLKREKWRAIH